MNHAPSTICFSLEDVHRDDHSELTGSCHDVDGVSQEDDFGVDRASDPCNHYLWANGSRISQNGTEDLAEVKMHLVRKQGEIDLLSSKLSQCEVDIEVLNAERSALVNELTAPSFATQPSQEWYSKASDDDSGVGGSSRDANAKLVAENARLRVEMDIMRKAFQSYIEDSRRIRTKEGQVISNLQQENELLWKHLELSSTSSPVTPTIPSDSKRECTAPVHPSDSSDFAMLGPSSEGKFVTLSSSERTGRTCPLDVSEVTLPQLGVPLSLLRSMALSDSDSDSEIEHTKTRPTMGFNESTEEAKDDLPSSCVRLPNSDRSDLIRVVSLPEGKSKNELPDAETRSEDAEGATDLDSEARRHEEVREMVVDFGGAQRANSVLRKQKSFPDRGARGGLLVDFGETRRPKRTPVRWHSFYW